jgi:hypothetical protein
MVRETMPQLISLSETYIQIYGTYSTPCHHVFFFFFFFFAPISLLRCRTYRVCRECVAG